MTYEVLDVCRYFNILIEMILRLQYLVKNYEKSLN